MLDANDREKIFKTVTSLGLIIKQELTLLSSSIQNDNCRYRHAIDNAIMNSLDALKNLIIDINTIEIIEHEQPSLRVSEFAFPEHLKKELIMEGKE